MAKDKKGTKYDESSIEVLEGLDGVRKKPGMYLGARGTPMVYRMVKELVDNCCDEFAAGRNTTVEVIALPKTNQYIVADMAQGIPVGKNKTTGLSTLTTIFTILHAGGKFNDKAYKTSCFTGETEIRLLDGRVKTLEWLAENYYDRAFWVISCTPDGKIMPGKAYLPRKTKEVVELIEVTLDNGKVERCTPCHRWMMRTGKYRRAEKLKVGDSLMPMHYELDKDGRLYFTPNTLEQPYFGNFHTRRERKISLHKCVYQATNPEAVYEKGRYNIHHANRNASDDRPENLVLLGKKEHLGVHGKINLIEGVIDSSTIITYNKSQKGRKKSSEIGKAHAHYIQEYTNSKKGRARASKHMSRLNSNENVNDSRNKGRIFRSYLYITKVLGLRFNEKNYKSYKMYGCVRWENINRYFEAIDKIKEEVPAFLKMRKRAGQSYKDLMNVYKPATQTHDPSSNFYNHKIVKIKRIVLEDPVPVYDISVEKYNNFLLNSGVFTHNSGVHGVGSSAVNAVCTNFDVWTKRDGIWYSQFFSEGKPVSELKKKAVVPKEISKYLAAKNIDKYGTIIRCVPDQTIVSEDAIDTKRKKNSVLTQASLDYHEAKDWLELIADLNPGLKVNYTYQKVKEGKTKTLTHEFHNKQGLASIVKDLCTDHEWTALAKPLVIEAPNLNLCIQWCSYEETDHFKTYVNTSPTREHGSHFDGFFSALSKAIARYNKEPARGKKTQFKPRDVLHGMIGVLNFKMSQAEFSSQTKDRLTSKVDKEVEELVSDELNKYFANNEKLVKTIIKRAAVISKGREELKKVMKSVSEVKKGSRGSLPSSLVASPRCKPEQRELVIVEGDSAGGSAKFARLPHQEIFKLTGKIANAARMPLSKLLGSETIIDLLVSIGIDPTSLDIEQDNPTFSTNKMRIKSLFILTDADPDGKHISVLLLTLLFRLIPDMFSENRVYFIDAPLYSAFHNNKRYMGPTFEAVYKQLPPNTPKQVVSRAKGWGEISPDMLHHVAFDPVNRKLICIKPPKGADEEWFRSIVGSDSSARKELLGL